MNLIKKIGSKLYVALFAAAILMAVSAWEGRFFGYSIEGIMTEKKEDVFVSDPLNIEDVKRIFPEAACFRKISEDEFYIKDVHDNDIGKVLLTMPSCRSILGYGGAVPAAIGLSPENKITSVILLKNNETDFVLDDLTKEGFLSRWNGVGAADVASMSVDAVSGATITSRAVDQSINKRISLFNNIEEKRKGMSLGQTASEVFAWLFLASAFLAFIPKSPMKQYRRYILIASVLIPGLMLARFLSLELLRNWSLNGIPWPSQVFMVVLAALSLLIPFFTGKAFYCAWYCPFGAAQEIMGSLFPKKIKISNELRQSLVKLRPTFLMIISFLLISGVKIDLSVFEPFGAFAFMSASVVLFVLAAVFLIMSLFIQRPWCTYFCPTGMILECVRCGGQCGNVNNSECNENGSCSSEVSTNSSLNKEQGAGEMKISEVINLLLIIAIIIILMGPNRPQFGGIAQQQKQATITAEKSVKDNVTQTASQKSDVCKSAECTGEKVKEISMEEAVMKTIFSRKSVRKYTDKEVTKEQLEQLAKAGMAAPSARNRQPWHIVIMDDKESMKQLSENLPYAKMLASASAAIAVCGDLTKDEGSGLWVHDCAAATENILLAAESMGLGAVWTAAFPYEDRVNAIKDALMLPENIVPLNIIPIGYPEGSETPKDKWKPEKLHWNKF